MADIFNYSDRSFKAFSKFYDKAPRRARMATAQVLSKMAFGTRKEAVREIKRTMTVRNPRFVERQMRFGRARNTNINNQQSWAGSIEGRNFTGWEENAEGGVDNRSRTQTLLARSGSFKKKVKPSLRMKPSNDFLSQSDFKLPSGKNKMPAYLSQLKRKHKNKPFIVRKKYKKMIKGLYKFRKNKPVMLQNLDPKRKKIKKNTWLLTAKRRFFAKNNLDDIWRDSMDDLFRNKRF